jgi:tRNA/rRNA methyltransferase
MSLRNCRVVLVRPHIAANLGATARVMRNMGLERLFLVAPEASASDREARRLSTHGEELLEQAVIVSDLREALADCGHVAATSARTGNLIRRGFGSPADVMPSLIAGMASGAVALVFGPEPSGLTDEEIALCHQLIRIPTDDEYSSLNLAQAVGICLYELRGAWLRQTSPPKPEEPPTPFAEQDRMFAALREAFEEIHFLYGPSADSLMHAVRRLIVRANPTEKEVKLLLGLARQIKWYVRRGDKAE